MTKPRPIRATDPITQALVEAALVPATTRMRFLDKIDACVRTEYLRLVYMVESEKDEVDSEELEDHLNRLVNETVVSRYDRIWTVYVARSPEGRIGFGMMGDNYERVAEWMTREEIASHLDQPGMDDELARWFQTPRPFRFFIRFHDDRSSIWHRVPVTLGLGASDDTARAAYRIGGLQAVATLP